MESHIKNILKRFRITDQDPNLELIKFHIERSISISSIKTTWVHFYTEFIHKKVNYNNITHEWGRV